MMPTADPEESSLPENDFARHLSRSLAEMYDRAAGSDQGLLRPVPVARGRRLLGGLGYPEELVARLPEELAGRAFPCACPLQTICALAPARLVDLGCGIGLDLLFSALLEPAIKSLHGFDGSRELRRKGAELLAGFPETAGRITLYPGDLNRPDELNLPPADLVLMNGSFNLVFDKPALLETLAGCINPGGRLLICDFILAEALPPGFADELDNWLWNIGGALEFTALEKLAAAAGFEIVRVRERERIDPVIRAEIGLRKKGL